jgi:probable phosphoglycerate mutase
MLARYVARHGETDWNRERRLQGAVDIPLNAAGRAQALALAEKLAHVSVVHLYVSALQRAQQTAAAFGSRLPRTTLAELNERSLGEFEGKQLSGMDAAAHEVYRSRKYAWDDTLGGGESLRMHRERVRRAIDVIRGKHDGGAVLVIAHGATNAVMLSDFRGREPHDVADLQITNGSVYRACFESGACTKLERL